MSRLFTEDFLHVSRFLLHCAFDLIGLAFGLKPFIADRFADSFFDLSFDVFTGSFHFVLIA
jgi:hypothetical protein